MTLTPEQMLQDIYDRTIRSETRLVQLGDHVGANLRSKQRIDIEPTTDSVVAYIDAMDVSLSRVAAEVERSEHWKLALPGEHHITIRLGTRADFVVAGSVTLLKRRG